MAAGEGSTRPRGSWGSSAAARGGRYLGVIGVLIPLGVSFYYVFIEAWTFGYFLKYVTGGIGVDPSTSIAAQGAAAEAFFNRLHRRGRGRQPLQRGHLAPLWRRGSSSSG